MNEIRPFQFDEATVRAVVIDGEPYFVGKDLATALGYANETDAMNRHCRGVVKRYPIADGLGRPQETRVLTEADMMRLIISSALPAAERFERWVFEDVLPTIRKTGQYIASAPVRPLTPAEMFLQSAETLVAFERQQAAITARQEEQAALQAQQQAGLQRVETRVEQVAAAVSTLTERPHNAESISHIKPRINKAYGIPMQIIEQVLRQLPYSPKPAGMVKNEREEAMGGSYAVYWIKDVNTVFRRFVSECRRETAHFVRHPDIEARFRLKPGAEGAAA